MEVRGGPLPRSVTIRHNTPAATQTLWPFVFAHNHERPR